MYPDETEWYEIIYPEMTFSNYEISPSGYVRRKDNHIIIRQRTTVDGYNEVKLVNDHGKRVILRVHRLVSYTFNIVKYMSDTEVNHIDGDKSNNHFYNLEWVTCSENQKHSYKLGLRKPANLKHSIEQIEEVCEMISDGLTNDEIISNVDFYIRRESIQNIRTKRTHSKISDKFF